MSERENHANLFKAVEDLARWTAWGGDYAHGGQFHSGPADTLGDIDEFLSDIVGAVGAGTGDIFESYDPLLYTVANVVNDTILGLLHEMTQEQVDAFNDNYCRNLERPKWDG